MDYINMSDAIETIVRTLESDVMSRVTDQYARSQLWASAGILANIAVELRQPNEADDGSQSPPSAEELLERVRRDVARQTSLHYKKAVSGS